MSADYDRLFHSSGAPVHTADDQPAESRPEARAQETEKPPAADGPDRPEMTSQPMPAAAPPPERAAAPKPREPREFDATGQMPPVRRAPQRPANGMMRTPRPGGPAGARYEQPRPVSAPPPRPAPVPAPTQHFAEYQQTEHRDAVGNWGANQQMSQPTPAVSNYRAIDTLSHVGVRSAVKMPPRRGWRRILYVLTRINLGLSPDEIYEMDLHARIRRNARDSYQIGVFGLKGGVGKTAVTVALGSALSKVRGDRILAVDADPDGGNLADRAGRQSAATIQDLLADQELARYNDIRAYTSMNAANLEVLSSEEYSTAQREFNDEDWRAATGIVSRYYNLVLADCGAGLFQPAARGVLSTVSGMVIVASASIDGARQAAMTMDWLRQNGYQDVLSRSCVVINHVVPGKPNIDVNDLVAQFERHLAPGRVLVLPWDKHVAAGTEIRLDLLGKDFQRRIVELAAALSDDFDRLERR